MKRTSRSKWFFGIGVPLIAISLGVFIFFRSEIDHILGGNTEVVDVSQFKPLSGQLAITGVGVLSADSQSMRTNQTVLIKDHKIQSVSPAVPIPNNYHVIDGAGKYLIPGLIDSHVHIKKSKNDLLLYIANGITHVAEMTGMKEHFKYRKEIENGTIGPDIYISSPKLTSQKGFHPTMRSWFEKRHQNFTNPSAGRKAVKKYKSLGYDSIKMSSDLEADIYFAINDEAKKQEIPVIGHLPNGLGMDDLYKSGQSQLAHIESITHVLMDEFGEISSKNAEAYLLHVRQNADQIAKKLKEKNIVVASTVWLNENISNQDLDLPNFLKTIELEYQNPGWVEGSAVSGGWLPGHNHYENPNNIDPESKRESEIYWKTRNESTTIITQALVRNGVLITAGTDAHGAGGVIAGFSLHDELESLSKIGLTNTQVLHSATAASAQWMGINTGKIETGYQADLVLLDKNPLENIQNTRSINAVIVNGKYLDRTQLDAILKAVKEANNRSRKVSIDEYLH